MSGVTCVRACKSGGLLVVALLIITTATGWGDDSQATRGTLRGLPGVKVLVNNLPPDLERAGLSSSQLQTDAELRLRGAGIRLLMLDEWLGTPGQPLLSIRAIGFSPATTTGGHLGYIAFTRVSLIQHVRLVRDPAIRTSPAETWSSDGRLEIVDPWTVRLIRESVADQVDRFINAYLSVNPLERPPMALPAPKKPTLDKRNIQQAQVLLKAAGFDPGPADGALGERTRAALRQYQQANGLPVTAELDQATQEALGMK